MKKIIAVLMAMTLLLSGVSAFAATDVAVYLNGDKQDFTIRYEVVDGHEIVPMRSLLEMYGYTVVWDSWNKWVYCTSAQGKYLLSMGIATAMNNGYGTPVVMSTYPRILDNTTMIPKDFAELLTDSSMTYNAEANSLMVLTNTSSGGALISGSGYING